MEVSTPDTTALAARLTRLPRRPVIAIEVPVAASRRARLLGLSRLEEAEAGVGLLIPRCRSIHTFGMRFPLDVFFLDQSESVVRQCVSVPPGRCLFTMKAHSVLELVPCRYRGEKFARPVA